MNQSWKDKKKYILSLIKKVSDSYGGDNREFLIEYAKDLIGTHKNDLSKTILCFESLSLGKELKPCNNDKNSLKINLCEKCGYRLVFCRC